MKSGQEAEDMKRGKKSNKDSRRNAAVEETNVVPMNVTAGEHTKCDECGKSAGTLFEREGGRLICLNCVPEEEAVGVKAMRLARTAVSGSMNIERRRRALERRAA